jgi:predicted CoA-binding protein
MISQSNPHPAEVFATLRRPQPRARIAVVGASNNPEKYGNIIVKNLKSKGYAVLPVNPRETAIEGLGVAQTLAQLPPDIDIVVMVTPPAVTLSALKEADRLGFPAVWLQDGSFDGAVLEFARAAGFKTVYDACVMVASN